MGSIAYMAGLLGGAGALAKPGSRTHTIAMAIRLVPFALLGLWLVASQLTDPAPCQFGDSGQMLYVGISSGNAQFLMGVAWVNILLGGWLLASAISGFMQRHPDLARGVMVAGRELAVKESKLVAGVCGAALLCLSFMWVGNTDPLVGAVPADAPCTAARL